MGVAYNPVFDPANWVAVERRTNFGKGPLENFILWDCPWCHCEEGLLYLTKDGNMGRYLAIMRHWDDHFAKERWDAWVA